VPLADLPAAWLNEARQAAPERPVEGVERPGLVANGQRRDELLRRGAAMRARGDGQAVTRSVLDHFNHNFTTEPLPDREVEVLAADIVKRYAPGRPIPVLARSPSAAENRGFPGVSGVVPIGEVHPYTPTPGARTKLVRFDVATMAETEPPPIPWIIDDFAARQEVTLLYARPGAMKSMLSLGACAAVATGDELAGMDTVQGRALYIDAENGAAEIHRRVRNLEVPARVEIYGAHGAHLVDDFDEIEAVIVEHRPSLVVLDSLRRLLPGAEENDSDAMAERSATFSCSQSATTSRPHPPRPTANPSIWCSARARAGRTGTATSCGRSTRRWTQPGLSRRASSA
jgi:hypothetical protein